MPANRFNGFHRLRRSGFGSADSALPAHLSNRSRSSTGSRSSPKTTWSTAAGRSQCSTGFSNSTASCSTASRCTSARHEPPNREHLRRLKALVRAPRRPGSPTTFAGAAWMAATRTTCCPCPTLSRRRTHRREVRQVQDFVEVPVAWRTSAAMPSFTFPR